MDVEEQNFNQQPANHMSASCEPAFVNFLKAKTQQKKNIFVQHRLHTLIQKENVEDLLWGNPA